MNSDVLAARIENLLGSSPSSSVESIPSRPPPPIPDHEIIARIGGGSYGEVWLARSITRALRAVKVVWRCHFSSERPYEREFHGIVQFEPLSRSHPGVVNVLHVGRDDAAGCFFYVMELADDANVQSEAAASIPSYRPRTLASDLKSRARLPVTDAVSLGVHLAGALGHLHRHGLVHRDVKPSNVIFVHGQPKLADIGLVTGVHQERSFVGTEGFIPPEGPGSERADLFGLGRLLYEAATGKNRCDFPGLPDDLDRWPKSEREGLIELNEVLARSCAPEAKQRHSNAAELAGDLNLILAGRSVRRAYRIERRLRRATLVSVAALVLVFATIFSNWLQRRQRELSEAHARREAALREETQKSLARAEAAERRTEQQLYTALLEQARAKMLSGEMGHRVQALDAIRRAGAISNSAELRREVLVALALPDLRFERELAFGADANFAFLDPSFERLAVSRERAPVEIRAVSDNRLLATLPASTNLPAFHKEWSADGRFLAVRRDLDSGARHGDWEIWDVAAERRVLLLRQVSYNAFSFHPRLPRFIARRSTEAVAIWNLEDGRELMHFPLAGRAVILRFSPDGERFAVVSPLAGGGRLSVHDATNPEAAELASHTFKEDVNTMAWHPDGRALVLPDHGGAVHWVDARTGEIELLGRHKLHAVRAVFSPDGAYLFTGGWERDVICWDARTKRRAFTASLNSHVIQFSRDGRRCAALTQTSVQLLAFERPVAHREFAEVLDVRLRQAKISPDGRWLAASDARRAGVWDLAGGGPGVIETNAYDAHFHFTPDGRELFGSRGNQGDAAGFRWRLTPATNHAAPPGLTRLPLRAPQGFTFLGLVSNSVVMTSSKGSQILAPDEIESGSGRWVPTIPGVSRVSPDGRWLGVYRPFSASLYVYRLPGLDQIARLTHPTSFGDFQFSPSGDEVAITSLRDGTLAAFWNTTTWECTRALTNFSRVLYMPDARTLWLGKDLRSAGLYDARTLQPLLLLPNGMLPLAISPDGQRVAVSVDAQRLQVWDLREVRLRLRELGLAWAGD
jgi:WD40 repeat protein